MAENASALVFSFLETQRHNLIMTGFILYQYLKLIHPPVCSLQIMHSTSFPLTSQTKISNIFLKNKTKQKEKKKKNSTYPCSCDDVQRWDSFSLSLDSAMAKETSLTSSLIVLKDPVKALFYSEVLLAQGGWVPIASLISLCKCLTPEKPFICTDAYARASASFFFFFFFLSMPSSIYITTDPFKQTQCQTIIVSVIV